MVVPLSNGAVALINDSDERLIRPFVWHQHAHGYAVASGGAPLMHRVILNAPRGVKVDHRDGDKLNNRRRNLRLATSSLNGHNRHAPPRGMFPVPGIRVNGSRFYTYIWVNNKNIYVGSYGSLAEAARARAEAELRYVGELSPNTRAWTQEVA